MVSILENSKIAIVGGGRFCLELIQTLYNQKNGNTKPDIIGVADLNQQAVGLIFAKEKGIFTTYDYMELFNLPGLNTIVELTKNNRLAGKINRNKPNDVQVLDHFEARTILDRILLESKKNETIDQLRNTKDNLPAVESLFERFYDFMLEISEERNAYSQEARKELIAGEKALSQIIQGTTIPTFVIDKDHKVTHWNKACEKLTGFPADDLIGTNRHWKAFRKEKRPADRGDFWRGDQFGRSTLSLGH